MKAVSLSLSGRGTGVSHLDFRKGLFIQRFHQLTINEAISREMQSDLPASVFVLD
jgi:hypothetical protein